MNRRSRFEQKQVDQAKPSWLYGKVLTNYLEDEVNYIQYGQWDEYKYYTFETTDPSPSSWIYFPTE